MPVEDGFDFSIFEDIYRRLTFVKPSDKNNPTPSNKSLVEYIVYKSNRENVNWFFNSHSQRLQRDSAVNYILRRGNRSLSTHTSTRFISTVLPGCRDRLNLFIIAFDLKTAALRKKLQWRTYIRPVLSDSHSGHDEIRDPRFLFVHSGLPLSPVRFAQG